LSQQIEGKKKRPGKNQHDKQKSKKNTSTGTPPTETKQPQKTNHHNLPEKDSRKGRLRPISRTLDKGTPSLEGGGKGRPGEKGEKRGRIKKKFPATLHKN